MKSLDVALEAMTLLLEIKRKCFDAERLWQVEEVVDAAIDRFEVIVALEGQDPIGDVLEIFNRCSSTKEICAHLQDLLG